MEEDSEEDDQVSTGTSKFGEGRILVFFFSLKVYFYFLFLDMGICMCLWSPEDGIGLPEAGVIGSRELSCVDTRNWICVLRDSSKCS